MMPSPFRPRMVDPNYESIRFDIPEPVTIPDTPSRRLLRKVFPHRGNELKITCGKNEPSRNRAWCFAVKSSNSWISYVRDGSPDLDLSSFITY
jgi:hypothetical protein